MSDLTNGELPADADLVADDTEQNPPLADPGSYDSEHGQDLDEPEEHPGVGN